jgi:hypothetical protein
MSRARFLIGKFFELLGMLVVGMALLAGLGITPDGEPSMSKQMVLLGIGGVIFTFGWLLESGARSSS